MKPHRIALTLTAAAALTGCGDPYTAATTATPAAPVAKAPAPASPADTAARTYALLARTWTPSTLAAQYRRQLHATSGDLHDTLTQTGPPARADVSAAAQARQSTTATVQSSHTTLSGDQATATVTLREIATSADSVTTLTRTYAAQLRRQGTLWLVTAFQAAS